MANKLNIYACTGIGSTDGNNKSYTYWTGDTNPVNNTQAENTILSVLNSLAVELLYLKGLTDKEKVALMNEIDLYAICLRAVRDLKERDDALVNIGYVIDQWIKDGRFNLNTPDQGEHNNHVIELTELLNEYYTTYVQERDVKSEFITWWLEVIVPRNKVGLSKDQRDAVVSAESKMLNGVGLNDDWVNDKNISNYLLNSALYFTYYYLTEDQLKQLPIVFRRKHNVQAKTYYMCSGYFINVYGSKAEMDTIIRDGIIKAYGYTPEEVCASIVAGDIEPVYAEVSGVHAVTTAAALGTEAIVSIILTVVTVVGSIIVAIINCIKDCVSSKYQAVTAEQAAKGCPNPEDFDGLGTTKSEIVQKVKNNWPWLAAVGVALVWFFKRN